MSKRLKRLMCYLFGHDWSYYNFTRPVIINHGDSRTFADHGRKCKRCEYDEYKNVRSFIDFVEASRK